MRRLATIAATLLLAATGAQARAGDALVDAIRTDEIEAVRAALEAVTDIDRPAPLFTPLAIAAIRGDTDIVTLLLDAGADPDAIGYDRANALSMAVLSCRAGLDVIETLIDAGADIENRPRVGITPLMLAIREKRTEVALRPLAAGADVDTLGPFGNGVLNYAIYVKEPVLINAALDRGVDTAQLRKLFTTVDYDPPGIGDARSHHEVLCDGS